MNLKKGRKQFIVFLDCLIIVVVCLFFYIIFPNENGIGNNDIRGILPSIAVLILCETVFQLLLRTYSSLWRYAEAKEYLLLFSGTYLGYLSYYLIESFLIKSGVSILLTLSSVTISFVVMLLMRFSYRVLRRNSRINVGEGRVYVAIVGAGEAGIHLMEEMLHLKGSNYYPYCFFDDDCEKIGKYIQGIEVKGPINDIPELLKDTPVYEIIVSIPSLSAKDKRRVLTLCSKLKCRTKILPDPIKIMQDVQITNKIRNIKIDDLLGRDPIILDDSCVKDFITGKVVIVTGGGGSIGSELCRQIAMCKPKRLIIVDIYENNAYDIQQDLIYKYRDELDLRVEIASVRDTQKVEELFERYSPQIVIHAAAHKHVPFMEICPEEAIKNNVMGTYNVVHAADRHNVEKFVLISTDKAVNPTNAMGASKRLCEMVLQSMKTISNTKYVAVRFGNVLGSNGSVIPLFQNQIEHGGPVTITDKRIVRYFMTIPEAAQLVLQAGAMADRSQIFVLDMGDPVKILDLAENLIRLSGYIPHNEIAIEEVGLRPGEKLFEELLMSSEQLIETKISKIFIEQQMEILPQEMENKLIILNNAIMGGSAEEIIIALKMVVPTYRSPEEVNSKSFILDCSDIEHTCGDARLLTV